MNMKLAGGILAVGLAAQTAFGAATDPSGLTLVDLTSPDGNITSSNPSDGDNDTGPAAAFNNGDGDVKRFLISSSGIYGAGGAVDIIYEFDTATKVTSYGIYNYGDNNQDKRPPKTWTFSGSTDGENWTLLDTQSSETGWAKNEYRFYYFGDKGSFTHYRFAVTANNGNIYTQFARMEFYGALMEDAEAVSFGTPYIVGGGTSFKVSQPYSKRGDADIESVSLFVGQSADALIESDAVLSLADGEVSFKLENLAPYSTYYWQLKFSVAFWETVKVWSTAVGETKTHRVATLKPRKTNFASADSWDINEIPDQYTDVVIDGEEVTDSAVSLSVVANTPVTNGWLKITKGDKLTFVGNNGGGSTPHDWYVTTITNYGHFVLSGAVGANDQSQAMHAADAPFYNGPEAMIEVLVSSTGYRSYHTLYAMLDGSVNDGTIHVKGMGDRAKGARLAFVDVLPGVLENNGEIIVQTEGGYKNKTDHSYISFAGAATLAGTGIVWIDNDIRSPSGNAVAKIVGPGIGVPLVNSSSHTIKGNGNIESFWLRNEGVIHSVGTNTLMTIQVPAWRNPTLATTNAATGRIIADSDHGILFSVIVGNGVGGRPGWNARFINLGLLESRNGSFIQFNDGINSSSDSKSEGNLSLTAANLELWGTIAGGGEIRSNRAIYIGDGAILAPGDRTDDTWSAQSTCGTLSFMSNVVMRANCTNEFQFAKADKFDSLHVGGTLKVDGTLKIVGRPHGGTFRMITSDNPITSDNEKFFAAIDLSAAEGGSKPRLKSGSETKNITVETGETDPDTGDLITETVEKTIYYIEATFGDGYSIIIR